MNQPQPHVLYVQMVTEHRRITPARAGFARIIDLVADVTPVVEQPPPVAFLLDVAGALRFFGRGPAELAARLRVRALALHDLDLTIGAATNQSRPVRRFLACYEGEPDGHSALGTAVDDAFPLSVRARERVTWLLSWGSAR
jgi:hypothetical protein